jgi:hypothetical protein
MVVERRATVDEYEAVVIAGVNHLALIDLPENAFFLSRIVEPLDLPRVAVPVLVA